MSIFLWDFSNFYIYFVKNVSKTVSRYLTCCITHQVPEDTADSATKQKNSLATQPGNCLIAEVRVLSDAAGVVLHDTDISKNPNSPEVTL